MILPNNGKVVIIDDVPDEVLSLMSALSKEGIPFHYYHEEDGSDLPSQPIENVRLIFLDLMLISDDETTRDSQVIAAIAQRLKLILSVNNGPYALVIWSTKEKKYKSKLMKEFKGNLKAYKPLMTLSLDKTNSHNLALIKRELKSKFLKFKSFNSFLTFEALVNKSVGELTNEFSSIYSTDNTWEKNIQGVFYSLAEGLAGKRVSSFNSSKLLKTSFTSLSMTLNDTIEKNIHSKKAITRLKKISSNPTKSLSEIAYLNTKLHLLVQDKGLEHRHTGNLYFTESTSHDINEIMTLSVFKNAAVLTRAKTSPRLIELDVTPLCDYAQNKAKYTRLLPGVAFPLDGILIDDYLNKFKPDYVYLLCPPIIINNLPYWLFFDFRFLISNTSSELLSRRKPTFRLKSEMVTDIQTNLGKHINRPGIISMK
jgi:hypothetical protein